MQPVGRENLDQQELKELAEMEAHVAELLRQERALLAQHEDHKRKLDPGDETRPHKISAKDTGFGSPEFGSADMARRFTRPEKFEVSAGLTAICLADEPKVLLVLDVSTWQWGFPKGQVVTSHSRVAEDKRAASALLGTCKQMAGGSSFLQLHDSQIEDDLLHQLRTRASAEFEEETWLPAPEQRVGTVYTSLYTKESSKTSKAVFLFPADMPSETHQGNAAPLFLPAPAAVEVAQWQPAWQTHAHDYSHLQPAQQLKVLLDFLTRQRARASPAALAMVDCAQSVFPSTERCRRETLARCWAKPAEAAALIPPMHAGAHAIVRCLATSA